MYQEDKINEKVNHLANLIRHPSKTQAKLEDLRCNGVAAIGGDDASNATPSNAAKSINSNNNLQDKK